MPFITKSNARKITQKADINKLPDLGDTIYIKPIYFLAKWEIKRLALIKTLIEDPESFLEIYRPIELKDDTFTFVFEDVVQPSYHSDKQCTALTSNFKNFKVPYEIKDRTKAQSLKEGKTDKQIKDLIQEQVKLFRDWFKENLDLFDKDIEQFLRKLDIRWNVQRKLEEVELGNSGTESIEDLDLAGLEKAINKIISEAGHFYNSNVDKQPIIKRFQGLTFLAYKPEIIAGNDTGLTDEELKEFLKTYDLAFKKPIKELLIQYYKVKYNPDLSFEGSLLDRLNFKPCFFCYREEGPPPPDAPTSEGRYLKSMLAEED